MLGGRKPSASRLQSHTFTRAGLCLGALGLVVWLVVHATQAPEVVPPAGDAALTPVALHHRTTGEATHLDPASPVAARQGSRIDSPVAEPDASAETVHPWNTELTPENIRTAEGLRYLWRAGKREAAFVRLAELQAEYEHDYPLAAQRLYLHRLVFTAEADLHEEFIERLWDVLLRASTEELRRQTARYGIDSLGTRRWWSSGHGHGPLALSVPLTEGRSSTINLPETLRYIALTTRSPRDRAPSQVISREAQIAWVKAWLQEHIAGDMRARAQASPTLDASASRSGAALLRFFEICELLANQQSGGRRTPPAERQSRAERLAKRLVPVLPEERVETVTRLLRGWGLLEAPRGER